jgi:exodeoxyribonuclease VII large subunit
VVAAIGHETDTTIAELVADVRGATPTQAAMRIFPDGDGLRRQLRSMGDRLTVQVSRHVKMDRERLRGVARHPFLTDPGELVSARRDELRTQMRHLVASLRATVQQSQSRLDRLGARLERHRPADVYARRESRLRLAATRLESVMAVRVGRLDVEQPGRRLASAVNALLERRSAAMQSAARGLDLVGPPSVLKRGYSITLLPGGRMVRSAGEVSPGQTVTTRLADGSFDSTVRGSTGELVGPIAPMPTHAARAAAVRTRPIRRVASNPDQLDLFGPGR